MWNIFKCQHNILSQITERDSVKFGSRITIIWKHFKCFLSACEPNVALQPTSSSSFKVGYLSVHVCLKKFGSMSYLCYSLCLNFLSMLLFWRFFNYANINLIIQDELTACQCLLLFITLDETGNWRGCTRLVWISSSLSWSAYIR